MKDDYFSHRVGSIKDDYSEQADTTQLMAINHFKALVGASLDFYGADTGENAFKVDDVVFKVLEDPDDGYRSCLGAIDYTGSHNSIFFSRPITKVKIEAFEDVEKDPEDDWHQRAFKGYRLIDTEDNHTWLEIGTDHADDYYPYFVFRYYPKKKRENAEDCKQSHSQRIQ